MHSFQRYSLAARMATETMDANAANSDDSTESADQKNNEDIGL
jgi:hypothetical protein